MQAEPDKSQPEFDPPDRGGDDSDLDRWCRFHQEVERLPAQEREVVGLIFYHGWTQTQVAELFQVNVRTVRRWWEAALVELHRVLSVEDEANSES